MGQVLDHDDFLQLYDCLVGHSHTDLLNPPHHLQTSSLGGSSYLKLIGF